MVLDAARQTAQRAGSYDLDESGPASEVIVVPVPEGTDVRKEASHLAHATCQVLGWPTEGLDGSPAACAGQHVDNGWNMRHRVAARC